MKSSARGWAGTSSCTPSRCARSSTTLRPLRDYVRHYNIKPGWTFLTGRRQDVERVRVALGFVGDDAKTDADITQHTGMLRIGNDRLDRWTMTPALGTHRQIKRTILELT